jgi:hypothetical protein
VPHELDLPEDTDVKELTVSKTVHNTVIVPVLRCALITKSFCFLCLVVCVVISNAI